MVAAVYAPEQWKDFFVMVGGGSAALTGLVFVALSFNLAAVTQDATHRYRAVGTLTGFVAAFATCALVLMGGQNHLAVGIEWTCVAAIAATVHIHGIVRAKRLGASGVGLHPRRLVFGIACYLIEVAGAVLIILGYRAGLYVAAGALTVLIGFMISGAWLLIVGANETSA